jgi:hypothetical protein
MGHDTSTSNRIDITASGRTERDVSSIACGEGPFLNGLVEATVPLILFGRCAIVNTFAQMSERSECRISLEN